jgi:hypothetical protein
VKWLGPTWPALEIALDVLNYAILDVGVGKIESLLVKRRS